MFFPFLKKVLIKMKDNFSNYDHPQLCQWLNRVLVNIADKSLTVHSSLN